MHRCVTVIEKTLDGYSAPAPDVPGVATVGDIVEETLANMHEA